MTNDRTRTDLGQRPLGRAVAPPKPGEVLAEHLKKIGLTQTELARRTRLPIQTWNAIVRGHRGITPKTALYLGIEAGAGTTAAYWMEVQNQWDLWETREQLIKEGRLDASA